MTRTPKRVAMLAALLALTLFVAACGSSSSNKGGSVKSSAGQKIPQGKQGGELTVLSAGDVDYMDPGQMYYTFGYMIGYSVNRALYSFKPDNAEKPVPDIAAADPQISSDGKTITVFAESDLGKTTEFCATVRIDTPQEILYYQNGGILQYVLRQLAGNSPASA